MKRATVTLLLLTLASSVTGVRAEEPPRAAYKAPGAAQGRLAALSAVRVSPVPSRAVLAVTRQGTWAYANPAHGPRYLAIPEGPGWLVTVCGPADCFDRVSTDAGPALYLQRAGRIGDLSSVDFERACGVPTSFGLCPGSYTIQRRPTIRLPETSTQ